MRELILTGVPELWPQKEKEALFSGPWCFANHPRYDFWEQSDFTLAPTPWKTKQDIFQASRYLDSWVDRMVPVLARYLNQWHGTEYSESFWRISMICWLIHWVGIVYERFQRLRHLNEVYAGVQFSVRINASPSPLQFRNYTDFAFYYSDHYTNLSIFSQIIQLADFAFLDPVPVTDLARRADLKIADSASTNGTSRIGKFRRSLRRQTEKCLLAFSGIQWGDGNGLFIRDRFLLSSTRFSRKKRLEAAEKQGGIDQRLEKDVFTFEAENRFELLVSTMIWDHLPQYLFHLPSDLFERNRQRKIWIGNDIWNSELSYDIATIKELGGHWVSVQHGEGYGQKLSFPPGKMEYECSDGFISWGWKEPHIYRGLIHPLPSPKLSKLPRHRAEKDVLIHVGGEMLPYCYRLHSSLWSEEFLPYLVNKREFLLRLSGAIRTKVRYRCYQINEASLHGTGERKWILETLAPEQMLDSGSLIDHMCKARLVVIDHLGTTLSECMAMNVPTICFWDPQHFQVRKEAESYFDQLRNAGILFDCPRTAAQQVDTVWENVEGWWHSKTVQLARARFCKEFAMTSKNWRTIWRSFLKQYNRQLRGRS